MVNIYIYIFKQTIWLPFNYNCGRWCRQTQYWNQWNQAINEMRYLKWIIKKPYTVSLRSLDPFCILNYYIKWAKTLWTYSRNTILHFEHSSAALVNNTRLDGRSGLDGLLPYVFVAPWRWRRLRLVNGVASRIRVLMRVGWHLSDVFQTASHGRGYRRFFN